MNLKQIILNLINEEPSELTKILDERFRVEQVYPNGLVRYSNGRVNIIYDPINKRRIDCYQC